MNKLRWTCNSVGGLNEPVPVQTLNLSTCYSSVCMCVCVCPSKYAQQAAICQQWSLPWVILVWSHHNFNHVPQLNNFGTHLSNWSLTRLGNSITVTKTLDFVQCLHHGLRWCVWCSAAPSVHAKIVFVMSSSDVASSTTFWIIYLPCDFFNLLWPFTVSLFTCQVPLAKCFQCSSRSACACSRWREDGLLEDWGQRHDNCMPEPLILMHWLVMVLKEKNIEWFKLPVQCLCSNILLDQVRKVQTCQKTDKQCMAACKDWKKATTLGQFWMQCNHSIFCQCNDTCMAFFPRGDSVARDHLPKHHIVQEVGRILFLIASVNLFQCFANIKYDSFAACHVPVSLCCEPLGESSGKGSKLLGSMCVCLHWVKTNNWEQNIQIPKSFKKLPYASAAAGIHGG